ncbi:threonine/serine exporter family protein [Fervidibacillus halotolerans]|uniref:Threonine/serine exporter family protein n=1 Tax=Fervidibacillus halotolerans TaxID=2980027 RepID=A0A9E8RXG1_9BACI|nr:threonine/serine exporter family protein [Fervidibacillus halotolerans]WAA12735.1 threonine/serine exporter family protein [Fervidibacillus halotolerans]
MFFQLLMSFAASSGFGIMFNVPKNSIIQCGFTGMIGWLIYISFVGQKVDAVPASFIASFFVALISHIFAKWYKTPVIVFIVGGIIPLVPGGLAYDAMRHFVINDYYTAIQLAAKVLLVAGAIAIGIVFSEVFNQIYKRIRMAKIRQ